MYKWIVQNNTIQHLETGKFIPVSETNRDWVECQKWIDEGNTPLPADVIVEPDHSEVANAPKELRALALVIADLTNTPINTMAALFKTKYNSL